MTKIVAKDGDRLDGIVYKHFGHLAYFEQVLSVNAGLNAVLRAGDIVIIPDIKEVPKKGKTLW